MFKSRPTDIRAGCGSPAVVSPTLHSASVLDVVPNVCVLLYCSDRCLSGVVMMSGLRHVVYGTLVNEARAVVYSWRHLQAYTRWYLKRGSSLLITLLSCVNNYSLGGGSEGSALSRTTPSVLPSLRPPRLCIYWHMTIANLQKVVTDLTIFAPHFNTKKFFTHPLRFSTLP